MVERLGARGVWLQGGEAACSSQCVAATVVERLARRSRGDVVMGCFVGQQPLVEVAMGCIRFTAVKLVVAAGASMCWRASLGRGLSAWWSQRGLQQQCGGGLVTVVLVRLVVAA